MDVIELDYAFRTAQLQVHLLSAVCFGGGLVTLVGEERVYFLPGTLHIDRERVW
jgi:hypothetical protein